MTIKLQTDSQIKRNILITEQQDRMNIKFKYFVFLMIPGLLFTCHRPYPGESGWNQTASILNQITLPVFPDQEFSITNFGAIGDGMTDCTVAFRQAIEACCQSGGGRVVVPEGVFLTGAIHLKSHVNLHLLKGATVLFSQDLEHYLRVNFIQFYRCQNILIEGVGIQRSPMWEIHPVLSENITIRNVHVVSYGPNNDGCNPECCRNVLIENCYFDNGDDCIGIKSGRNGDGRRIHVPSENIYVKNIEVGEVADAVIRINFYYEKGDAGFYTPIVKNIYLYNIKSKMSRYALALDGYERSPITHLVIESCDFRGVKNRNIVNHVKDVQFKNVKINGKLLSPDHLDTL